MYGVCNNSRSDLEFQTHGEVCDPGLGKYKAVSYCCI